jgi:membrane protein DedA with SNARE-associated domain
VSLIDNPQLTELLHHYSYGLLGLVVALEAMGLPLPGESLVIAAALYAGTTHELNIGAVVAVTAAAAIVGDNLGYLIGRSLGLPLIRRYGRYVWLTEERLNTGRYLFAKHGGKVVLFGRFIAVLRTLAALLAGVTQMHWTHFLVANAIGGILWASVYGFGAYFLGRQALKLAGPAAIVFGVIAVVAIAIGIWIARRHERQLAAAAQRAFNAESPG